jgi:LmbE family N-acetylglucosaminyl deacetylase
MFSLREKAALVVVAHGDDEILGAGMTMQMLVDDGWEVSVLYLTLPNDQIGVAKPRDFAAASALRHRWGLKSWVFSEHADLSLWTVGMHIIAGEIEQQIAELRPSLVFGHHEGDLHPDHRVASWATKSACRRNWSERTAAVQMLLSFEIPANTSQGGNPPFMPNVHVRGTEAVLADKQKALVELYPYKIPPQPHPRNPVNIEAMAIQRGAEILWPYAEAFGLIWSQF